MSGIKERVFAVLPLYNNGSTVKEVAARTCAVLPHVLIVDDGSTDLDLEAAFRGSDVTILRHSRNLGKGAALITALEYLKDKPGIDYMITLDADGQHEPEDIPLFFPLMERNDYSLIVGCRDLSGEHVPRSSRFGREFANFWMRVETGIRIDDCQSGFRAYPVKYVSRLPCFCRSYSWETEILVRAAWANLELHNLPVHAYYPEPSKRVSHFRPVLDNFRLFCLHFHLVGVRLLPIPKKKLRPAPGLRYSIFRPGELLKALLHENASPLGLAVSAGVGSFLAVLPLPGFHILTILYVTERLHLNKIMALAIQNLYMPPVSPVLCIELGYRLRYGRWLTELTFQSGVRELHLRLFEWFLGSLLLAPFWMMVSGAVTWAIASFCAGRMRNAN